MVVQSIKRKRNVPTYLIKNSFNIYNFQYRFNTKLQSKCTDIPKLFRRSLKTGCYRTALKQSKYWLILTDELTQKLLTEPELFGKAMTLLKKYRNLDMDWQTVEEFLMELGEDEAAILDRAIEQHSKCVIKLPFENSAKVLSPNTSIDALIQAIQSAVKPNNINQVR